MDLTVLVELVVFAVLMLLSGFFSSSETSLFSLNDLQLEQMRRDDNPRIALIERMLSEPRRLIVTILIGNEFVNVAASVISAAIVIQLLGAENKLVNLFIMVPILLLVGEITPKTLAIRNKVQFATFQSQPIDLFARMIAPLRCAALRWAVRLVAEWFTTLIVGHELDRGSIVTRDMVRTLAHEAVGDGVLDEDEAQYIEQIFDFGNRTVEDLMTPRSNVEFLSADLYTLEQHPEALADILREPYFVPETKSASELFHTFRKRRLSVTLAVDEYGGITGLISMEDLLECIFGDIPSPSDEFSETDIAVSDDGTRRVDGGLPITQFNEEFDAALEEGDFETVAGRILHEHGELPEEGAVISVDGLTFTVEEVVEDTQDEYDSAEPEVQLVRRQADGTLLANARVDLDDLAEELGVGLHKGRYSSLAGFLLEKAGEVTPEGSSVDYKDLVFTVTRGSARSIQEVKISVKSE